MAYGSSAGVEANIKQYSELISSGQMTLAMVTTFRSRADAEIDSALSGVVAQSDLPLVSPPAVVGVISDLKVTCYILTRIYCEKDPDESAWVDQFCTKADDLLETLLENPEQILNATGGEVADDQILSTTLDQDREFTVTTESGGSTIATGTMEDW
jgi:hypothetical protein